MSGEIEIHIRENSQETEAHKDGIKEKLLSDCLIVYRELLAGHRHTSKTLTEKFGAADWGRRCRNLRQSKPNEIKSQWLYTPNGKRTRYMEFWIDVPRPPTKKSVHEFWKNNLHVIGKEQKLFE